MGEFAASPTIPCRNVGVALGEYLECKKCRAVATVVAADPDPLATFCEVRGLVDPASREAGENRGAEG